MWPRISMYDIHHPITTPVPNQVFWQKLLFWSKNLRRHVPVVGKIQVGNIHSNLEKNRLKLETIDSSASFQLSCFFPTIRNMNIFQTPIFQTGLKSFQLNSFFPTQNEYFQVRMDQLRYPTGMFPTRRIFLRTPMTWRLQVRVLGRYRTWNKSLIIR